MPIPTLVLPPEFNASKSVEFAQKETKLGDGYSQVATIGKSAGIEKWSVRSGWLTPDLMQAIVNQLSFLKGVQCFAWNPNPGYQLGKVSTCDKFDVVVQAGEQQLQLSFSEFLQGECEPYRDETIGADEIRKMIDGMKLFISTYTGDQSPMIITGSNVAVNSFQDELGRGNYFPSSSATSEGQVIGIREAANAFLATGDEYWKKLAVDLGNAFINYFYPTTFPPANLSSLNDQYVVVPHWLINAKEPFVSKAPVAPDPLNYGYFGLVVNFTNGIGYIPASAPTYGDKLADVYSVIPLDAELLWKNVHALPRGNPDYVYAIDYWVSDLQLKGRKLQMFADTKSNSGRSPVATTEPVGKIKLVQNFTGQAKVTFSTYTGAVIGVNQGFEADPMWRSLRPTQSYCAMDTVPWTWSGYQKLFQITGDAKWQKCQQATQITETLTAKIFNPTDWYKKENSADPFRYPGSQVILVNNDNGFTASRVSGGDKNLWLRLDIPTANKPYPQVQLQNYAVQAIVSPDATIHVEVATSIATTIDVILSLSSNAFDFSQYYFAKVVTPGSGTPVIQNFTYKDFLHWDLTKTVWYGDLADNALYTYQGNNGQATTTRLNDTIDGVSRYIWKLYLKGGGGYAGGGFVYINDFGGTLGAKPSLPLRVSYKHKQITDGGAIDGRGFVTLNVKFGTDVYQTNIYDTNGIWTTVELGASNFVWISPVYNSGSDPNRHPPTGVMPDAIYIESLSLGTSETYFYWLGSPPTTLPSYVQTYKAVISSKIATAHTLWIGDFSALNSPSSVLKYNPGVSAFTANTINYTVDSWQGNNEVGYAYPAYHVETGNYSKLQQVLDYLSDSQAAYTAQNINKTVGCFCPSYNWSIWFSYTGIAINSWTFTGVDPNTSWEGYSGRPFESISMAWYLLVAQGLGRTSYAKQAQLIAMKFCGWLFGFYKKNNSNQPPTNFPAQLEPVALYHTPHFAALALRGAIYCNLAGGDPLATYGVIKASYEYLKSQYVSTGTMTGSFTFSQSEFTNNGSVFKEYFFFWHAEILGALVLLLQKREDIRLPSCSAPLI